MYPGVQEIPFLSSGVALMNQLGARRSPFLFVIDYEMEKAVVLPLDEIDRALIQYAVNGIANCDPTPITGKSDFGFDKHPIGFEQYRQGFDRVMHHIRRGNSFLTNYTVATPIQSDLSLKELFAISNAPYKLWIKDRFTLYSPEKFITIRSQTIRSFPMKGTIDAALENAPSLILTNEKEMAEHYTIVDLIRNDLSRVARRVRVERFRYLDKIETNQQHLWQVSSEIAGEVGVDWPERIGTLLAALLPAGSITGAPKKKTMEIIAEAETTPRGYYTGIFGLFDGTALDSAVMIRFVENRNGQLFYRSGGGITVNSICENEYRETIEKIYVPLH